MCKWTETISDKDHISKIFNIIAVKGFNSGNYAVIKTYTGENIEGFYVGFYSQSNRFESFNSGIPEKFKFGINIQNNDSSEQVVDALDIYDIKLFEKENKKNSVYYKKVLKV